MPYRLARAKKIVGAKQTLKAIQNDQGQLVYVAKDADERVTGPIHNECRLRGIPIVEVDSMAALGRACSIEVGAAVAAILKDTSS